MKGKFEVLENNGELATLIARDELIEQGFGFICNKSLIHIHCWPDGDQAFFKAVYAVGTSFYFAQTAD